MIDSKQPKQVMAAFDRIIAKCCTCKIHHKDIETCIDTHVKELVAEIQAPDWMTVEQFTQTKLLGHCWIVYKGKVVQAFYSYKDIFLFSSNSPNAYMTECITAVAKLDFPKMPKLPLGE